MSKLVASKTNPPLGAMLTASALGSKVQVTVSWGQETSFTAQGASSITSSGIARCLARQSNSLYGSSILEKTEIDHWLTFSLGPLTCPSELQGSVSYLDTVLQPATYLVGDSVSIADYEVYGRLANTAGWLWMVEQKKAPTNLLRWYNMMSARQEVKSVLSSLPKESRVSAASPDSQVKDKKDESAGGKFVDLPGAKMGEVCVRFPPEASGYLHVGHAKAALLNYHYKETFQGKLVMRFDDTNPAKEKEEYEHVILDDIKMLQVKYDHFSRTSDHFETILLYCEKLLKSGKAYVDDTDAETMKKEREEMKESRNRNNSVEQNMKMWDEMKRGTDAGTRCAVRAKMDMKSANGCMRDPTIYRCKPESHPATGNKYKVYPTYDFACPIVDSVEGITHALRTTEYMDRDEQFFWFIDALGLRKPHIYAYARLNLTNTVMSKRKLTWLVDTGAVDGWDDPRMPTVRGIMRRGLTVEALKQFILAQGSSRSVVYMEWDKIWAFNKKVLDPVVPRHTTIDIKYNVPVLIKGQKLASKTAARHPKNPEVGEKQVWTGPRILIDGVDAEQLKENENATFINWGNLMIKKVNKTKDGKVESVEAEDNTGDTNFKKTLKVTWLCDDEDKSPKTPAVLVYYDHIISKAILDKDDDFKNYVNKDSKFEIEMLGDPELKTMKRGEMIQVQRRGYFICDVEYKPYNPCVGRARPCVLICIPDGSVDSYGPPGKKAAAAAAAADKGKKGAAKAAVKAEPSAATSGDKAGQLNAAITAQGDIVRKLKADKAAKPEVNDAVNKLLALKAEFKTATGREWKPGMTAPSPAPAPAMGGSSSPAADINAAITTQGDLVRKLKADKAAKAEIDEAVKKLLALKSDYKSATGQDWKPGCAPPAAAPSIGGSSAADINASIVSQGDLVRKLKADKAAKADIDEAVKKLLALKGDYKSATGQDWKPGCAPPATAKAASPAPSPGGSSPSNINAAITAQGDIVRKLKADKAAKAEIEEAVKKLLALKADFKSATGSDWKPACQVPETKAESKTSSSGNILIRHSGSIDLTQLYYNLDAAQSG